MPFIEWNDEFSVGVCAIDVEHKSLVVLLNHLYEAIEIGHDKEIIEKALDALIKETTAHFEHEEYLLKKTGYPDEVIHKLVHEQLIRHLCDLRKNYRDGKTNLTVKMVAAITANIIGHIEKSDKKFGQFLKERPSIEIKGNSSADARLVL